MTATETGVNSYALASDREIVITRVVDAPRRIVYDAWTNPKHVQNWMGFPEGWTMPVCEMDLRPGGSWHYVWRRSDGDELSMTGIVRELAPPERLVTTESWGPEWPETINTLELTETGGRTTIKLTILYPSREDRDAALQTGMKEGLDVSYARLDSLLAKLTA